MSIRENGKPIKQPVPPRIMMLVPHEPELDPRIRWVANLCRGFGRTEIIGFVYELAKPQLEYDNLVSTDRVMAIDYPRSFFLWFIDIIQLVRRPLRLIYLLLRKIWNMFCYLLLNFERGQEIINSIKNVKTKMVGYVTKNKRDGIELKNDLNASPSPRTSQSTQTRKEIKCTQESKRREGFRDYLRSIRHWFGIVYTLELISNTLFQRARTTSIIPRVVICHDIFALGAAVKYKHLFGTPIIYDSHELWPEADLRSLPWEKKWTASFEQKLIRQADLVITVNPQIANHLEKLYQIENVISVPNAEPLPQNPGTARAIPEYPLKFLLQGQATPKRGIEEFMDAWQLIEDERAVLIVRCPENPFLACLRQKYQLSIEKGKIIFAPAVSEDELVRAAGVADVGVIPYTGPNLNHVYACPNKLSQYMQAGLVIFHNSDQIFVSEMVDKFQCGLSYDINDPQTIVSAVSSLTSNLDLVRKYQLNSYKAALSEFNWEMQSKPYFEAIQRYYGE